MRLTAQPAPDSIVPMSAADDYTFRPFTPDDAEELAKLHIQIWRDTYTGLMDQDKLDALDPLAGAQRWRDWMESDDAPATLGAFTPDGQIAGWITVGAAREDDAPSDRELWVLNVAKEHHGTGLAHELMRRELADGPAYLWVVDGNDRAQAFYRKYGFELDGARRREQEGNDDLRMTRS